MKRLCLGIISAVLTVAFVMVTGTAAFAMDTSYIENDSVWNSNENVTSVDFNQGKTEVTYQYYYDSSHGCFYLRITYLAAVSDGSGVTRIPFNISNSLNSYSFTVDENGEMSENAESVAERISVKANMKNVYSYGTAGNYYSVGTVYIGIEFLKSEDKKVDGALSFSLNISGKRYKLLSEDIELKNVQETTTAATSAKVTTTKVTTTQAAKTTTVKSTTAKTATTAKAKTTTVKSTSAAAQQTTKYTAPATTAHSTAATVYSTTGISQADESTAQFAAGSTDSESGQTAAQYSAAASGTQSSATSKYYAGTAESTAAPTQYDAGADSGEDGAYISDGSEQELTAQGADSGYYTITQTKNTLSKPAVVLLIIAAAVILAGLFFIIIALIKRRKTAGKETPAEAAPDAADDFTGNAGGGQSDEQQETVPEQKTEEDEKNGESAANES